MTKAPDIDLFGGFVFMKENFFFQNLEFLKYLCNICVGSVDRKTHPGFRHPKNAQPGTTKPNKLVNCHSWRHQSVGFSHFREIKNKSKPNKKNKQNGIHTRIMQPFTSEHQ